MIYILQILSRSIKLNLIIILTLSSLLTIGQSQLSEKDVLLLALENNPSFKASLLNVKRSRQLEKTSFNLDNPNIIWESPSGEFMTFGITQTIAFPTVYTSQNKLAKANTKLSGHASEMTRNEIVYLIKLRYLDVQVARARLIEIEKQKIALERIADAGKRQFESGDIDFVSMTYASSQYGELLNLFNQAIAESKEAEDLLKLYTTLKDSMNISSLVKRQSELFLNISQANAPSINYLKQGEVVAEQAWIVEKNKALPGFTFGYQNQGIRETPQNLRMSFGLSVPLWFWQYSASMKAAKTNFEMASETTKAEELNVKAQWNQSKSNAFKYFNSLSHYEKTGLDQANDLITASERMFKAGQTDYISYLRTLVDAYAIQLKYLETLKMYNQSIITLEFLNGNN